MKIDTKIPYYVVKKGKYGYWQPTRAMRDAGFSPISCGRDGPEAWAVATQWNHRWYEHRRNSQPSAGSDQRGYVYFAFVGDRVKIGFSVRPLRRIDAMITALHEKPRMIVALRGTMADERALHQRFAPVQTDGEWFEAIPDLTRFVMRCAAYKSLDAALSTSTHQEQTVGTVPTEAKNKLGASRLSA